MRKTFTQDQLVALLKTDSNKAFEYLYDNYASAFSNIIFKIVKDKETASDTLQDAFVKIWMRIGSFDAVKGTLFTWMVNIVRNTAIDRYRSEKALLQLSTMDSVTEFDLVYYRTLLHPTHIAMDLLSFVERLPAKQKELIKLIYFEGYTCEEAADSLSIPTGTAKSRIRKGLSDLRQIYVDPEEALEAA